MVKGLHAEQASLVELSGLRLDLFLDFLYLLRVGIRFGLSEYGHGLLVVLCRNHLVRLLHQFFIFFPFLFLLLGFFRFHILGRLAVFRCLVRLLLELCHVGQQA